MPPPSVRKARFRGSPASEWISQGAGSLPGQQAGFYIGRDRVCPLRGERASLRKRSASINPENSRVERPADFDSDTARSRSSHIVSEYSPRGPGSPMRMGHQRFSYTTHRLPVGRSRQTSPSTST